MATKNKYSQFTIEQLRIERNHISARIGNMRKRNKDVTDLVNELEFVRSEISKRSSKPADTTKTKKVETVAKVEKIAKPSVTVKKSDLTKCQKEIERILDENDWRAGYQFRSSECMFIKNIATKVEKDAVVLDFVVEYKTRNHRVVNNIVRRYTPATVGRLQRSIDKLENWVMMNSGDMDDKSIVFGTRFNKIQFDEQGMERMGWVIKK